MKSNKMKFLFFSEFVLKTGICFLFILSSFCLESLASELVLDHKLIAQRYSLSLEDVTQLSLKNNFDIQLAKYDAWIARIKDDAVESIYDTFLSAEVTYRDNQRKQTSTIFGTKVVDNDYNVGVSKKTPFGTTLNVDMTNNRNASNSVFSTSSVTHDSTLNLTVKQELGKNFFGIQDRGGIKITRIGIQNEEHTSLDVIETSIAESQKSYWDLVLAHEQFKIQKTLLEQAKRLYDLNKEKHSDGLMELPDVIASEVNYHNRKNELIFTQNEIHVKTNILKLFLNIEDESIVFETTQDLSLGDIKHEVSKYLKEAFVYRQDYKKVKNDLKGKDVALSMKKQNLWPEINLTASLERNGLGDHFKQAVTQITDEDNPNLFAGLSIKFSLENKEARSGLKAAELEKAKELVQLKFLERRIMTTIVNQVKNCNVFLEVASNDQFIAELQAKKLEEEEKRFHQGRSDTDTLVRFQEDLGRARVQEVSAKHRYHTAVIDLKKESGVLLEGYWDGKL